MVSSKKSKELAPTAEYQSYFEADSLRRLVLVILTTRWVPYTSSWTLHVRPKPAINKKRTERGATGRDMHEGDNSE